MQQLLVGIVLLTLGGVACNKQSTSTTPAADTNVRKATNGETCSDTVQCAASLRCHPTKQRCFDPKATRREIRRLVGKLCRCPDSACAKPLVATLASLWGYFDSGSRLIAGARRRAAICQASAEYPSVRLARKWADQMCRCRDQACVTSTQSAANPLRKADRGTSLPPAVATKRDKHWARYSRCAARFPSK
ncbi:MAG: hypothetical protein KDA41_01580 [Planctomycetales bacterium]|nr:hypothetical protein [Planctomycetales bacterium]